MGFGGAALRFSQIGLRVIEFLAAAVALGIFSYFLSVLADHSLPIASRWKAVEGISGAAVLYTICGVLLTLCLGGVAFFGFVAVVLDVLFAGAFIAVAWITRHGAGSCSGNVQTPLGSGPSNANSQGYGSDGFGFGSGENVTYLPNLGLACSLNTAVFAVSIISIFLFLITAALQVLMVRHHKKEKRYGPSPANNYTSGSGKKFWKRNKKTNTKDAEAATAVPGGTPTRVSADTMGNNAYTTEPKYGQPGYGQTGVPAGRSPANF